jgi:phosphinothricin acetyltransferase
LHEKLGFCRAGVLANVGYKHGRWVDSVLLQRSLGAGSLLPPAAKRDAGETASPPVAPRHAASR